MRQSVEAALALSCGIIKGGDEVVPRYDVMSPDGDFVVFCPLPDDYQERLRRMAIVKRLMACRMATAFVCSCETQEPDAVCAIGVTRCDVIAAWRPILRAPVRFGDVSWMAGRGEVGDEIPDMLPDRTMQVSSSELAELERVVREWHPVGIKQNS